MVSKCVFAYSIWGFSACSLQAVFLHRMGEVEACNSQSKWQKSEQSNFWAVMF